jgi:hypothetical protein
MRAFDRASGIEVRASSVPVAAREMFVGVRTGDEVDVFATAVTSVTNCVPLKADGVALTADGVALRPNGVALRPNGVALKTSGVALKADRVALKTSGVALRTNGDALERDGARSVEHVAHSDFRRARRSPRSLRGELTGFH